MDIEASRYSVIQKILQLKNAELISKIETLIQKEESNTAIEFTQEVNEQISISLDQYQSGRVISADLFFKDRIL